MSSDAGLTPLHEIERKAGLAPRFADCLSDPRDPGKFRHVLDDIIRFRIMMFAAGYEDGNDAEHPRHDPGFKLALERGPKTEAALIRMGREMIRLCCQSLARPHPDRIVLDIDDTLDARTTTDACATPTARKTSRQRRKVHRHELSRLERKQQEGG